jgi:translation initiation factor IF-2
VIYALAEDVRATAEKMVSRISAEQVTGSAKVVALFKGDRKGIIIGCGIADGYLALGQHFRIISAIGPIFSGVIESLHVGENAVQKATPGQQVGIKIKGFNKARIGDIVESFRPSMKKARGWEPSRQIIRK